MQERVDQLLEVKEDVIKDWTDFEWTYPKGDLFQFVKVLNRFEGMESTRNLHMPHGRKAERFTNDTEIQAEDFLSETKLMILAMIRFTSTVYDNCVNKRILSDDEVCKLQISLIFIV